jgi:hypothetical protein
MSCPQMRRGLTGNELGRQLVIDARLAGIDISLGKSWGKLRLKADKKPTDGSAAARSDPLLPAESTYHLNDPCD